MVSKQLSPTDDVCKTRNDKRSKLVSEEVDIPHYQLRNQISVILKSCHKGEQTDVPNG